MRGGASTARRDRHNVLLTHGTALTVTVTTPPRCVLHLSGTVARRMATVAVPRSAWRGEVTHALSDALFSPSGRALRARRCAAGFGVTLNCRPQSSTAVERAIVGGAYGEECAQRACELETDRSRHRDPSGTTAPPRVHRRRTHDAFRPKLKPNDSRSCWRHPRSSRAERDLQSTSAERRRRACCRLAKRRAQSSFEPRARPCPMRPLHRRPSCRSRRIVSELPSTERSRGRAATLHRALLRRSHHRVRMNIVVEKAECTFARSARISMPSVTMPAGRRAISAARATSRRVRRASPSSA